MTDLPLVPPLTMKTKSSPLDQHAAVVAQTDVLSKANLAALQEEIHIMESPSFAAEKLEVRKLFDRGVPYFTKLAMEDLKAQIEAIKGMAENGQSTDGQKFVFASVTGQTVERPVMKALTRSRPFGKKLMRLEPSILYNSFQALLHSTRYSDQALCALQVCYAHQTEPQRQSSLEDARAAFRTCRERWRASGDCRRLRASISSTGPLPVITKIIAFACASFSGGDDARRRRPATQHALIMTLRDILQAFQPSQHIECLAQDPAYTEVDKIVLSEHGINVVDDPQGFLEVDDRSVVLSFAPNVPVRQIITDIARPAMLIWNTVTEEEHTMSRWAKIRASDVMEPSKANSSAEELEACETDPPSSRVRAMIQEEYAQVQELDHRLFGESSVYIRRDARRF